MNNNLLHKEVQLSVIIPCFNGTKTLAVQLEALANQQWSKPWEVIITDNGSTDGSIDIAEKYRHRLPNLQIVDASAKRGASYARNIGIKAANSDAFVFCDVDDEVSANWLASVGEALTEHDFISGPVEFKQLNQTWRVRTQESIQQELPGTQQEPPFYPWGNGCNFGFTRLVLDTVGGFDESVEFCEDVEFSWRAQQAGFKLHFVRNATVHYRLRHGLIANYRQARNWAESGFGVRYKYGLVKGKFLKLKWFLGGWKALFFLLLKVRTKEDWVTWMRHFGARIGEIQGVMKYL